MKLAMQNADCQQLELMSDEPQTDAQKNLEQNRQRVLNAVASGHLDTMQERVAWILNHCAEARDSDITLQLRGPTVEEHAGDMTVHIAL